LIFDIEAGGRLRTVDVRRAGSRWVVTVDGTRTDVDAVSSGTRLSLLIGSKSFEIAIDQLRPSGPIVYVNGEAVAVSVSRRRPGSGGRAHGAAAHGPSAVVAPMPGRVVRVLVRPDEEVSARQGLVVVEAMKMENELRSPRAGRVREVKVAEGALVEANDVLVIVE
jgi:biotin carboxyl carrier protein